jgi:hypothetical protein
MKGHSTVSPPVCEIDSSNHFEKRKAIVHVDDNADAARHKQAENVSNSIQHPLCGMTVPNGVYAENEMKRVL